MSRRSLVGYTGMQHRAASRMTVGTRMWSDQPTPLLPYSGARVTEPEVEPQPQPEPAGFPASNHAYSSANPPYPSFSIFWQGVILSSLVPTLTPACVVRITFTVSAVDEPTLTWFHVDARGFASGTRASIPYDPHYPGTSGTYPAQVNQITGNAGINVTGGPFTVGQQVEFTFNADYLYDQLYGAYYEGDLSIPSWLRTSNAVLYVVTP